MLFWNSMSIAQQLVPIYNTTVHNNIIIISLYVAKLLVLAYLLLKHLVFVFFCV